MNPISNNNGMTDTTARLPLVHIYTQNVKQAINGFDRVVSPWLPTCDRVVAASLDSCFLATNQNLALIQPVAPPNAKLTQGRHGPYSSAFIPLRCRIAPLKEHATSSQTQMQTVAIGKMSETNEMNVASVDSRGRANVTRIHVDNRIEEGDGNGWETDVMVDASATPVQPTHRILSHYPLLPERVVEDGWHGIAVHPHSDTDMVVASYFGRSLSIYSQDRLVQRLHTHSSPVALEYLSIPQSHSPLLACCEGNTLSIWDLRLSNSVGQKDNVSAPAIHRLQDGMGDLYTLDTHHTGLIATGGADKQVSVYDCRKWQVSGRWKNVLKFEVIRLRFCSFSPSHVYVAGLDHEVCSGTWLDESTNQRSLERHAFRGDSRWVGLDRTRSADSQRGDDHLLGVTATAQLYVVRNAHLQSGPVPDKAAKEDERKKRAEEARERNKQKHLVANASSSQNQQPSNTARKRKAAATGDEDDGEHSKQKVTITSQK